MESNYGQVEEYSVNKIIENIIEQVDEHGWDSWLLVKIVSVLSKKDAIPQGEDSFTNINKVQNPIITTKVWDLQVKWNDGSTDWFPITVIKE